MDEMKKDEDEMLPNGMMKLDLNGPVPSGRGALQGGVKQLMTCPYDESHRVGFGHFSIHLVNCRQRASEAVRQRFVICKYNATHHMDQSVYQDHLLICEDRRQNLEFKAARTFTLPPGMAGRKEFIDVKKWDCYGEKPNKRRDDTTLD